MFSHRIDQPTVGWIGTHMPADLGTALIGWNLHVIDDPGEITGCTFLAVETDHFRSLRACQHWGQRIACPILFVCPQQQVSQLVNELTEKDDVCLADSPTELLATRLFKLQQASRAMIDPLTGVQRREAFFQYLRFWATHSRHSDSLSVGLFDLDNFKRFNERFGHEAGDVLLQKFAALLRDAFTDSPLLARLGGQEFIAVLPEPEHVVERISGEICKRLKHPDFFPRASVSVSVGIAGNQDVRALEAICEAAEEALYAAKAAGRDQVCVYSQRTNQLMLAGEDPDLANLENRSRVMGERVTSFIAQRSRKILQNLRVEAESDGLTKFFTRRYLDRRLDLQFRHHRQAGEPLSVALIDLDHFGSFNKKYGWPTGDKTLTTVADVIRSGIRLENDWVGRYGGEEFCVVLPGVILENAIKIAERLRGLAAATQFTSTAGDPLRITLSVGVVQMDQRDADAAALIERLSKQTLRAKESGRNQVCWETSDGQRQGLATSPAKLRLADIA